MGSNKNILTLIIKIYAFEKQNCKVDHKEFSTVQIFYATSSYHPIYRKDLTRLTSHPKRYRFEKEYLCR